MKFKQTWFKMSPGEKHYLANVCRNCIQANGSCVRREPYVGLCAKNDAVEMIIDRRSK